MVHAHLKCATLKKRHLEKKYNKGQHQSETSRWQSCKYCITTVLSTMSWRRWYHSVCLFMRNTRRAGRSLSGSRYSPLEILWRRVIPDAGDWSVYNLEPLSDIQHRGLGGRERTFWKTMVISDYFLMDGWSIHSLFSLIISIPIKICRFVRWQICKLYKLTSRRSGQERTHFGPSFDLIQYKPPRANRANSSPSKVALHGAHPKGEHPFRFCTAQFGS